MKLKNPIWFFIPRVVEWLTETRNRAGDCLNFDVRSGINLSIILNSACYVEGALESGVSAFNFQRKDAKTPSRKEMFALRLCVFAPLR